MKKIGSVFFTCIMVAVAWLVCGLLFANYESPSFYYWGGFGFGLMVTVAVCLANYVLKSRNKAPIEVNVLPTVISFGYLIIGIAFNVRFMIPMPGIYEMQGTGIFEKVLIAANILLLLVFILTIYFASGYKNRVSEQVEIAEAKIANTTEIMSLVARLLSQTKDEEVRNKLYTFKEKIDYSTNVSQSFSVENEEKLMEKLRSIGSELNDGASKERILSDIEDAEKIWNMRNAKISTLR